MQKARLVRAFCCAQKNAATYAVAFVWVWCSGELAKQPAEHAQSNHRYQHDGQQSPGAEGLALDLMLGGVQVEVYLGLVFGAELAGHAVLAVVVALGWGRGFSQ